MNKNNIDYSLYTESSFALMEYNRLNFMVNCHVSLIAPNK